MRTGTAVPSTSWVITAVKRSRSTFRAVKRSRSYFSQGLVVGRWKYSGYRRDSLVQEFTPPPP